MQQKSLKFIVNAKRSVTPPADKPVSLARAFRIREKSRKARIAQAVEDKGGGFEYNHDLIDYRSDNQVVKSKMMSCLEASEKNHLLRGSGFAWARVNR